MRIIVSGGGTGGHIYPAITLINEIKRREPEAEFLYVGTSTGLEADIIPKENIPFSTVDIQGFERHLTPVNLWRAAKAGIGTLEAMNIVRKFSPDVAVGTGGYVCGPILLASSLLGIPTLIQEQNAVAGITNKLLGKFATRVAAGTAEAAKSFPAAKTVYTGNPIRHEVMEATREQGLKELGLKPGRLTVLVSGGSRGARSLNNAMIEVIDKYAGNDRVQILHVTGSLGYEDVISKLESRGIDHENFSNISVAPYLYNMPMALAAADLAIFRAGAIGIAELTARGIPAILVPYPYAAENHQEHNALAVVKAGGGRMILDRDLTGARLMEVMEELLSDEKKLKQMAKASRRLGKPRAAKDIADIVMSIAGRQRPAGRFK